ncbi:hypothetical protein D6827_03540 [Candidatus Parcubacteria bacterium]|nr:MAG: hypothetical protein D6827_03540 [Candidatus Parcubacteria bacterium]
MITDVIEGHINRAIDITTNKVKPPTSLQKTGKVVRPRKITDVDGATLLNDYIDIVSSHQLVMIDARQSEIFNMQFLGDATYFKASHKISPLIYYNNVKVNDFYVIDNVYYRITHVRDSLKAVHIWVWNDKYGKSDQIDERGIISHQTDLNDGSYSFGTGNFTVLQNLSQEPFVFITPKNDGEAFLTNITTSGFTINDRGIGQQPIQDVIVLNNITNGGDIYLFRDISTGSYTFGSGTFSGISFSQAPIVITSLKSDGDVYISNVTSQGFTINDRFGNSPIVDLLIIRNPNESGRTQ